MASSSPARVGGHSSRGPRDRSPSPYAPSPSPSLGGGAAATPAIASTSAAPSQRRTSYEDDSRRPKAEPGAVKADQIVQHFYSKTCTIVSQSRMTHLLASKNEDSAGSLGGTTASPSASTSGTSTMRRGTSPAGGMARRASTQADRSKSVHKWFNIELADSDIFRNELKTWRSVSSFCSHSNSPSSSHPPPTSSPSLAPPPSVVPPMILDILLDTKEMMPNQVLVVSDHRGRRVRVDPSFATGGATRRTSNTSLPPSGMRSPLGAAGGRSHAPATPSTVVLERWTLSVVPHGASTGAAAPSSPITSTSAAASAPTTAELPAVYKRAIIHFRTLYSTARVLPSWNLHRRLARRRAGNGVVGGGGLMIGCRMSMSEAEVMGEEGREGEVALETSIGEVEGENVTETIHFPVVVTPLGGLRLTCTYRLNADFAVEDIETLLSSRFIDEDFFKPTMARYQQEAAVASGRPGSLPTAQNRAFASPSTSPPMTGLGPKPSYGSLSSRHHLTSPPVATSPSVAVPITRAAENPTRHSAAPGTSPLREGSASSSGRLSVYGSSAGAGGHVVEPAFISLSRTRGASYSSQIQRATTGGSAAQQIVGSSVPRRPSFTTSGSSPLSSSPIFRASSYLSSPPAPQLALSSSPSTGPTSNIHRVGQASSNSPSSLGLGFARQQQTGFVPSGTLSGGTSPSTATTGPGPTPITMAARSPLSGATSAPRPIPSPSSGSIPRYSTSGGSYSRSYGRGSSGGGSYGSLTGGQGEQWGGGPESLSRRASASAYTRAIAAPELDPKRFLETAEDDSDDINAFLGMIDSRPELMRASMIASSSTGEAPGETGTTKTQVDEQLKALRGSVYGNLGADASPPLGFGAPVSSGASSSGTRTTSLSLRKQTSRLSIQEEPSQPPERRPTSVQELPGSLMTQRASEHPALVTAPTVTPITFPHYISPRTRVVAPAVTTTGFELPVSRPDSTTATPPTGHSSMTSFSSRSGYAAEEEAVGRLELGDPDDDDDEAEAALEKEEERKRGRGSPAKEAIGGGAFKDLTSAGESTAARGGSRDPTPGRMTFNRRIGLPAPPVQMNYFDERPRKEDEEQEEESGRDRSPGEVPWMG